MYHKDVVFDCIDVSSAGGNNNQDKCSQMDRIESKLDELIKLVKNLQSK